VLKLIFSEGVKILIIPKIVMKKLVIPLLIIVLISTSPAYGHKLISNNDSHRILEKALEIPDHTISWAIYEELGKKDAKFYKFNAIHGESFYASIVIPKISGLENYSPTLALAGKGIHENDKIPIQVNGMGIKKTEYRGDYPGREFYESFGQVTYWERQELKTTIPMDGEYYIIVFDEKNQSGKYSLAIGTVEDFSVVDIFTTLPKSWFETKIFVDDYLSIGILISILIGISIIPMYKIIQKRKINEIRIS